MAPPYEPGPIDVESIPIAPPIVHDGTFAALGESITDILGASDTVLGGHQLAIASNTGAGLDEVFATTIGRAADLAATQPDVTGDQTASRLVDAGAGTEAYRTGVLPFLPQPEAPIAQTFRDFPTPDFGAPGSSGGDGGDTGKD